MTDSDNQISGKSRKESIIDAIKRLAMKILPIGSSITLFGSQARGDNREDSDWDILILMDREGLSHSKKGEFAYPFVELGWHLNAEINPIVHSYNEWNDRRHLELYHNINAEGTKIWG